MKGQWLTLEFIRQLKKDKRGLISKLIAERGNAFMLKGLSYNVHFISDPTYIKHLLIDNSINYIRPPNVIIDSLFIETSATDIAVQNMNEDRVNVLYASLSGESVKKYANSMIETTAEMISEWENNTPTQKPIGINSVLTKLTLKNLGKTLFSDAQLDERIPYYIKSVMYLMIAYDFSITKLPWRLPSYTRRRTQEALRELNNISRIIAEYCLSDKTPDDNLLKNLAKLHTSETNLKNYSKARVAAILFAAFHLIADSLTGIFVYLSLYPLIAQKIHEEIKSVIGDRQITINDVNNLRYTQAVISETLRLSVAPPFIPRFALNDDAIGKYTIKKGDRIYIPIFYLHRLSQYWDNPEGFDPNRFLKPLDDNYRCIYLPFGAGPRMCVGKHFAYLEITIVLAMVIQKFYLNLVPNQSIDPDIYYMDPDLHPDVMMTLHSIKAI
jgi:cytochrome P450